jgi:hypothetical protein
MRPESLFGIATGYGLDDRGVGVRVPIGSRIFFSSLVQSGSGVHPTTSYPMGTAVKRPGCEADHSPPVSAEVKKISIYTSMPSYTFMA